jgi:hypothetical protein
VGQDATLEIKGELGDEGWRCTTQEDPGRRRIVLENKGEMGLLAVRHPEVAAARGRGETTEGAEGTEGDGAGSALLPRAEAARQTLVGKAQPCWASIGFRGWGRVRSWSWLCSVGWRTAFHLPKGAHVVTAQSPPLRRASPEVAVGSAARGEG